VTVSIATVSGKGGVGKTTTVINLGAALAETGRSVLAVDCDPQSNLTSGLGLNPYEIVRTLSDAMTGTTPVTDLIVPTEWQNLSLLAASPELVGVESELDVSLEREVALRNAMHVNGTAAAFDIILYDTPPSFGFHTISALAASDYVLIPLQMSGFAIRGFKEVLRAVHLVRTRLNPNLQILGIVPTWVNLRTKFSRQLLDGLCELASIRVFDTVIAPTVKLQETSLVGIPVIAYAPKSKAAEAYRRLAQEVLASV
jgi:chromosome partitioning protein